MSKKSLREQLVGAWTLSSCVERDIETGVETHPLGERPLGLILYTPDGYMSAQLQRPQRPPFAEGDLLRATPEEYAAAGSSYIAYSGRFFVDEAKKSLSHEMAVSFFPNWVAAYFLAKGFDVAAVPSYCCPSGVFRDELGTIIE